VIGIFNGMNARIDKSGRIVVPKSLLERLGLKPNTEFELVERADSVLLRPVEQPPSTLKIEGLWGRWQAAQGAMLSGQRVVEHIILAAFRDAFSLRQPCVPT
jgi:AbrB family looped-hinge helix DNA binding protein